MIITKTNKLFGVTPTGVIDGGVSQPLANITDPDHSLTYTSGTSPLNFQVSFGAQTDIEYVAVSGHDATSSGNNASIAVFDNGSLVNSVTLTRNNNVVITFTKQNFTDLQVKFTVSPNTYAMTVSYIAAGEYFEVQNGGEQAGYSRLWLDRALKQRTATNTNSSPLALTQRRRPLKATLSIPAMPVAFSQSDWQDFLTFALEQPFFIREVDGKERSSYICFNPVSSVKAHPQTRALDSVSLKFDAFNGI